MQSTNNTLPLTIQPIARTGRVRIEFNANRFEQLASNLGLFTKEFLSSLQTAEEEIKNKKTKVLHSFADLRPRV